MFLVIADNRLFFPILQPIIAGNPTIVKVILTITETPLVKLAAGDSEPVNEEDRRRFQAL